MTDDRLFTLDDLRAALRAAAGEVDDTNLDGDIADVDFDQLGYDSLALIETAARVSDSLPVALPEEELSEAATPRQFVALVNSSLSRAMPPTR